MREMEISRERRALGMLLGLHCGDALGATLEAQGPEPSPFIQRDITGGGPLGWRPGQATDDTDLAIVVLNAITSREYFSFPALRDGLIDWFTTGPKDIGNTTRLALTRLRRGVDLSESGESYESSQGNGSLMRCAPLALLTTPDLEQTVKKQAAVTHAHPRCSLADWAFVCSLKAALAGQTKEEIYHLALEMAAPDEELSAALRRVPNVEWSELSTSGYVVDTLACAFWALLRCDGFEAALTQVVNRGDDADTCGAVAGALWGAYGGLDSIPERWLARLERGLEIRQLLQALLS